jgi:hypothetical protein
MVLSNEQCGEEYKEHSRHHLNLRAQAARLKARKNFFSNRVVEGWKKIPASLKNAKTVKSFKNGYRYAHLGANIVEST